MPTGREKERENDLIWREVREWCGAVWSHWSVALWSSDLLIWFYFLCGLEEPKKVGSCVIRVWKFWNGKPLVPSKQVACSFNQCSQPFVQQVGFSLQTEHVTPIHQLSKTVTPESRRFKNKSNFLCVLLNLRSGRVLRVFNSVTRHPNRLFGFC